MSVSPAARVTDSPLQCNTFQAKDETFPGDVKCNFEKFLIGKDAKPIARFEPSTKPDSFELVSALETALASGKPN